MAARMNLLSIALVALLGCEQPPAHRIYEDEGKLTRCTVTGVKRQQFLTPLRHQF